MCDKELIRWLRAKKSHVHIIFFLNFCLHPAGFIRYQLNQKKNIKNLA